MRVFSAIFAAACLGALALAGPAVAAPCYSSSPASGQLADSPADAELGLSPELTAMSVSIDSACGATFGFSVIGQASPLPTEFYFWFVNTDNNLATGAQTGFVGADHAVGLDGVGNTSLSKYNPGSASFVTLKSIGRAGTFAVAAHLSDLEAAPGVPLSLAGGAFWSGVYDDYFDFVPEPAMPWLTLVPAFSTTAPPVEGTVAAGCVVPNVRRLKPSVAKRRIRAAGCTVGATRKRARRGLIGRVYATSPRAGAKLAAGSRVNIYVAKRRKNKQAKRSSFEPSLARIEAALNHMLKEAE